MPSQPLTPLVSPLDLDHLARMTLGDAKLGQEVLALFAEQSMGLISMMATQPAKATVCVHKLKGSADGVGAFAVARAAAHLERVVQAGDNSTRAFAELKNTVADACAAIEALLSACPDGRPEILRIACASHTGARPVDQL